MPENKLFPPEGFRENTPQTLSTLKHAQEQELILEAPVLRCDTSHTLHISINGVSGQIPRTEAVAPWISGANRDIAVLSRVGKPTCFRVLSIYSDSKGSPIALLSRKAAQETAMSYFLKTLRPGMILSCCITRLEKFGVFLDIGCGIIAMLPIERISTSRITHPKERFHEGQRILAAVWSIDPITYRITMTHRELLGTWMENASYFQVGETVRGVVRNIKEYGSFIELTPNLSGLADSHPDLMPGDQVSIYIKSIRAEHMKIKLQVIQKLPSSQPDPLRYQITDGILDRWVYSPPDCKKDPILTDFTASAP